MSEPFLSGVMIDPLNSSLPFVKMSSHMCGWARSINFAMVVLVGKILVSI